MPVFRRMLPHTVTLYNAVRTADSVTNHVTVLRGVLLEETAGARLTGDGGQGADAARLHIPFDVPALRPEDAEKPDPASRSYAGPADFRGREDRDGVWTIEPGGSCWFVKGVAPPDPSWPPERAAQRLRGQGRRVYTVTAAAVKDFGGFPHIEAEGV